MDVLVLIDKLDDTVHNAKPVPLTDQVRVDKEEIYDILDQMRATIPEEIKQARWIVKERQEMLAEAKREAERIVKEARERQQQLISQEEITKQAERAADDIIEDARAREREIRLGAEDYADEILNTLEVNLSKFIAAVQRGRERLARQRRAAPKSPEPILGAAGLCRLSRGPCGSTVRPRRSLPATPSDALRRGTCCAARSRSLDTDITALEVDAIANAANTRPAPRRRRGRGDLPRRRSGGAARERSQRRRSGSARRSRPRRATCRRRWVIHAATMELGGPTSAEIIRAATARTLRRADELGARSLALVAFGTGVGGFPLDEAARIEVDEVRRHLGGGAHARARRLRGARCRGCPRVSGRAQLRRLISAA